MDAKTFSRGLFRVVFALFDSFNDPFLFDKLFKVCKIALFFTATTNISLETDAFFGCLSLSLMYYDS